MPCYKKFQRRRSLFFVTAAVFCFWGTLVPAAGSAAEKTVSGVNISVSNAVVVTADSIASAVGAGVLKDGGNAVDAAVAVGFALAVTLPRAGNIGGGGFMLIHLTDGQEKFVDYRERAPLAGSRDMYLDDNGDVIPDLSEIGHLASGTPGTVRGLALAHEAHGTLPWKRLVAPAITLARDGFVIGPDLTASLAKKRDLLETCETARDIFVASGYKAGDRLVQPDLAATLGRIANDWRDFYTGETARLLADEMERGSGLVTMEDLAQYRAVWREPIRFRYGDYEITSAPLPSSGGVILSQILGIFEFHKHSIAGHGPAGYVHLIAEAEKIAYRGRALYLGDEDFFDSPWKEMTDSVTIRRLADLLSIDDRLLLSSLESADLLDKRGNTRESSEQTTHFSIVDEWGNAVANTYTLNGSYGSGVVVKGAGFLLNNQMDDFAIKPGYPNVYGLVGSEANAVEPGKRMLSSMTPAFVYRNGELYMVLGTPGGSTIPTSVLQVILNVVDGGMTLYDAVSAKRFHEQYLPDRIYIENGALSEDVIDSLLELGHKIQIRKPIGNVQAILLEDGVLNGVSDPRGAGRAAGY